MAIIRTEKKKDFTVMSNSHFRNTKLSLKAKGLLSLMLSLPDGWDYSIEGLAALVTDGLSATRSALKELEKHGYLIRKQIRKEGRIGGWEYIIFETPEASQVCEKQILENQDVENQDVENQQVENDTQLNTYISNTKELNTKESNTQHSSVHAEVIESFNRICKSLPRITSLTGSRRKKISAILGQYTLDEIQDVFIIAESSDFLKGVNRSWKATFDWLMCENNFTKVREGNYDRTPCIAQPQETEYNRFMNGLKRFVTENA